MGKKKKETHAISFSGFGVCKNLNQLPKVLSKRKKTNS